MATSPADVRSILQVVRDDATAQLTTVARAGDDLRPLLLAVVPELVGGYTEGSSALAADWYAEIREEARARHRFVPGQVVDLDAERMRRTVLWATEPIERDPSAIAEVLARLTPRAEEEIARGFWDTIEGNAHRDPEALGWRRDTRPGACAFCRFLADKGAVYRHDTARFAAHKNCHCVAVPVFKGEDAGPEASALQYVATKRRRSPKERAALRDYLREHYGDN